MGLSLPEGHLRCQQDSDCPDNWICWAGSDSNEKLCFRTPAELDRSDAASSPESALDVADAQSDAATDDTVDAMAASTPDAGLQDINFVVPSNRIRIPGEMLSVSCQGIASPANEPLTTLWSASKGILADATASNTTFVTGAPGSAKLTCEVSDQYGGKARREADYRVYPPGWVTFLRFDGDASDSSGNGNHALVINGTYTNDRAGNTRSAIALKGNGTITLENTARYNGTQWTFAAMVRVDTDKGGTLISKASTAAMRGAFTVSVFPNTATSYASLVLYSQQGLDNYPFTGAPFRDNEWFHLVVTRESSGVVSAYIDGQKRSGGPRSPAPEPDPNDRSPVVIGNGPAWGGFSGALDEVLFYDRVLNADEIAALVALQ